MNIVVITVGGVALFGVLMVLTYKWVSIPLFTKNQGNGSMEGVVDLVRTLSGGVIEVGLKQEAVIDPILQQGAVRMTSASCIMFVHFRPSQHFPMEKMMVKAETTNRFYRLRGRSLNWVRSWSPVESIKSGVTVQPA